MKKIIFFWIVFILCCSGISSAYAADVHYDRLLNKAAFKTLDQSHVIQIQQNLAVIYQHDLDWIRDVRLGSHPLTDGLIGPVTLFWVQRFLFDFKIEPIGDFIPELEIRLVDIASFANMFPDETKILLSADFAYWSDTHPMSERRIYYKIRRSGSDQQLLDLVNLYLRTMGAASESVQTEGNELVTYFYQLTTEDFKILQSQKDILLLLAALENKHFDNYPELKEAVEGVLADYPQQTKKLLPIIEQYFSGTGITIDKEILARLSERMAGDPLFSALNDTLAKLLESTLSGVAYIDSTLFEQSVKSKIAAGLGACRAEGVDNEYIRGLKLNDDEFKTLSGELLLESIGILPNLQRDLLKVKALREDVCGQTDVEFLEQFNDTIYTHFVQPAISPLYRKKPLFKQKPIQWQGNGCGCLLDDLSGLVYGFYPFWLAGDDPQTVNFSVLSRVAYYGLSFDEEGTIKQTNAASDAASAINNIQNEFIQVARKHNSQVDWVIHHEKPYWDIWKERSLEERNRQFKNLADNIVSFLADPLTDYFSQIKRIFTLGIVPLPTRGDGVTLYFNGYPEDADSVGLFNDFVHDLRIKLDAKGNEYVVNIMAQQTALDEGKGVYEYTNLLKQISEKGALESGKNIGYDLKNKVLVLVDEPSSQSKRSLNTAIHDSRRFNSAEERKLLLRNIVPVIEFDGRNWAQLAEDLTYFEDNFGGIGFWPLIVNEAVDQEKKVAEQGDTVDGMLERYFQSTQIGEPDSFIDRFVCENRWYFYIAFVPMMVLLLILSWCYIVSCAYRENVKKYYIGYVLGLGLPLITISSLLAMFDPYFEDATREYGPLILVIIIALSYVLIRHQIHKMQMKKPSRPKSAMIARRR